MAKKNKKTVKPKARKIDSEKTVKPKGEKIDSEIKGSVALEVSVID